MSITCELCSTSVRECMRVPHYDSNGTSLQDHVYCTDCWVKWKNSRENLDGKNEHGVRCMTCPHCNKPVGDNEAVYMKVKPTIYDIYVGTKTFHVTSETTVANFKRTILWSTIEIEYTEIAQFDLVVDEVLIDGHFLGVQQGTIIHVVPRKIQRIQMQIFPSTVEHTLNVFATASFMELKTAMIGHGDPVLFDARSCEEFDDHRTVSSYAADLNIIAVLPRHLYNIVCFS
jgi:hypothetical protein